MIKNKEEIEITNIGTAEIANANATREGGHHFVKPQIIPNEIMLPITGKVEDNATC